MNPALQKTLAFLLLILAGYLLQRKIVGKQELAGVKVLILSIVLPATIFVALLKIEISATMLLLPLLALLLNGILYAVSALLLPRLGFRRDTPGWRTMMLLLPSLAPGLSVFPFILEYLGEAPLAMAALADVGNKVFVLIVLYLVAMNWYYARHDTASAAPDRRGKLKDLGLALVQEPVNLVILAAIAMLSFGWTLSDLPVFLEGTVARLASLMTPLVLLFIGMAVRFNRREVPLIVRVLCFRSGLAFLLSAGLVYLSGLSGPLALLAVIFAQCAVSFWPFAHMSAVEALRGTSGDPVFDLDLGLNVLAFSLPFSTLVILTVLSCGEWFAAPAVIAPAGVVMCIGPAVYMLRPLLASSREGEVEEAHA
ncbi:AEC family transporter [Neolewinella litorea]|uniref:Permease n=1 Tax=Neolewinella litorea TaxID=2562452 RepID=A0A4S4NLT9_9BACT|nr:permease [Neolewinella litorea]THH39311.1 permease [Neolewinella litorea]